MKTVHRVEVELTTPAGVKIREYQRLEVVQAPPGWGTSFFVDTLCFSCEGEREPVELLNELRKMAHALLDKLEGEEK